MKKLFSLAALVSFLIAQGQTELRYDQNQSLSYDEVIAFYQQVANENGNCRLREMGMTDSGRPLHLFVIGENRGQDIPPFQDKMVIMINNGIHPGESCGVDASIAFVKELLKHKIPDNVAYGIIPVYNVGGSLNHSCCTRANQDGPEQQGFRGNSQNLDLNRDFIKADALNTRAFYRIFHFLNPHIFVDTHTSNGADYQYTMTLISTQKDKLNPVLAGFQQEVMDPALYETMEKKKWEMIPYVNVYGRTPESGYSSFLETPRYASGYTTLFNTLGYISEAHMLKTYENRVEATIALLHSVSEFSTGHAEEIIQMKAKAQEYDMGLDSLDLDWALDKDRFRMMSFKGYKASYPISEVTGLKRLKYLHDQPVTYDLKYYDTYNATTSVEIPKYYVISAAWREVVELMSLNGVKMKRIGRDTTIQAESYYIKSFEFAGSPYEGHFPLRSLEVEKRQQQRYFFKGDFIIPTSQLNKRFIVSVLEPQAVDSYLRWNFFDAIFQQKEGFSSYVFDDTAKELLESDPELKAKFEAWRSEDPKRMQDAFQQLLFIYRNSDYYEEEHMRYPVARIN